MPQRGSLAELLGQDTAAMDPLSAARWDELAKMIAAMMRGGSLNQQLRPRGEHEYWWNGEVVRGIQAPTRDHYRIVRSPAEMNAALRAGEPPLFWQGEGAPTIEEANRAMQFYNENPETAWWERQGVGPQAPMVRR